MIDYKVVLGVISIVVGLLGYFPYIRNIWRGKTKPHTFSWLVWGTLEGIGFFAQLARGGGAGAWATAASGLIALGIAGYALRKKENQITVIDMVAFGGAVIGIALWRLTNNPLLAVVAITIADAFGFIPTFRKSWHRPNEETVIEYALSCLKWIIAIPALGALNLTTWLYPASLIVTNGSFVIMSLVRRHQIRKI